MAQNAAMPINRGHSFAALPALMCAFAPAPGAINFVTYRQLRIVTFINRAALSDVSASEGIFQQDRLFDGVVAGFPNPVARRAPDAIPAGGESDIGYSN